jgi:hypothetical protein
LTIRPLKVLLLAMIKVADERPVLSTHKTV